MSASEASSDTARVLAEPFKHERSRSDVYTYEQIQIIANDLLERTKHKPTIGIICGSGLGGLVEALEDQEIIPYSKIAGFPISTAPGHHGRLVFGILRGKSVMCMQGRLHPYEGYHMMQCAMPVRVMKMMGVVQLIVTNAAGGLNEDYNVGDIMIIKDHLNLPGFAGNGPLVGYNDERFGVRFPAMSDAYDKKTREIAKQAAAELNLSDILHEGVYSMQAGPCFESVAECKMLRGLGADVTGMSTVPEVIVAKHCGMKCFGMSLVTNKCVMEYDVERLANHEEVLETGRQRGKDMQRLVASIVERL